MRGDHNLQEGMFSYISPEKRVPADNADRTTGGDAKESEVTRDGQSGGGCSPLLEPPTTFADCEA